MATVVSGTWNSPSLVRSPERKTVTWELEVERMNENGSGAPVLGLPLLSCV